MRTETQRPRRRDREEPGQGTGEATRPGAKEKGSKNVGRRLEAETEGWTDTARGKKEG